MGFLDGLLGRTKVAKPTLERLFAISTAQVTLEAEVKREKEATRDERVLHTERVFGKVTRSFTLPQELDESRAEAKFRDGVLELTLPKKAAAQRKQISIQ